MASDPEQKIEDLRGLMAHINRKRAHLADEAEEIGEQWERLKQAGGKRADHAAALLYRLRPHLDELAKFFSACVEQIDAMKADPFQREVADGEKAKA